MNMLGIKGWWKVVPAENSGWGPWVLCVAATIGLHMYVYGALPPDGLAFSTMHGPPAQLSGVSGKMSEAGFGFTVTVSLLSSLFGFGHPLKSVTVTL